MTHALLDDVHSLVIVDDPVFEAAPGTVPVLVLDGTSRHVVADGDGGVAAEIERRLGRRR